MVVQHDGYCMSWSQFKERRMRLGYDRIKHQEGIQVEFPPERLTWLRKDYGRNGVGHEIAPKTSAEKEIKEDGVLRGKVMATTYWQLNRTADHRLFRLKERIPARMRCFLSRPLSEVQRATQAPLALVPPPALGKARTLDPEMLRHTCAGTPMLTWTKCPACSPTSAIALHHFLTI